jgi:hypothetical protein
LWKIIDQIQRVQDCRNTSRLDQLAKEAAKEAEALELNTQVFTKQDIRKAARDVVTKKWQVRWDSSNSGRHYYRFHKVVKDSRSFSYFLQFNK